ncbi:47 kDa outer membrane protein [bacterium HR18]|nr:47 kDa outer membrane protein [bacterium HR18]
MRLGYASFSARKRFLTVWLGVLLSVPAWGQGFNLNPAGTCTLGRGGTGVALPCSDGSALATNPAGIAEISQLVVTSGATLHFIRGRFTDDYTQRETHMETRPMLLPHLFAGARVNTSWAVGLGIYGPYGLETRWPRQFEGSFVGYRTRLQAVYIQPTLAYAWGNRLQLGVGPLLTISTVSLWHQLDLAQQQALPNVPFGALGIPAGTAFANAKLESQEAYGLGAHLGMRLRVTDQLHFGLRYLTPVKLSYTGHIRFSPLSTGLVIPAAVSLGGQQIPAGTPLDVILASLGIFAPNGPLADREAKTELTLPAQLAAGLGWEVWPGVTLLLDYQWTEWSRFDRLEIRPQNGTPIVRIQDYRNTSTVRVGLALQTSDVMEVRMGYSYSQHAAPSKTVTPLLPESNRNHLTLGMGWKLGSGVMLDIAYQYVRQDDRRGRVVDPAPGMEPSTALNSGLYRLSGHVASISVSVAL